LLLDAFTGVKCQETGTPEQVTTYTHALTLTFQKLRRNQLVKQFSAAGKAQMFYNNLTKLVKHHMALRDPQRKEDSELHEDLSTFRHEVREVITWQIYKEDVCNAWACNGRHGSTTNRRS
jgi:hypothetical protein